MSKENLCAYCGRPSTNREMTEHSGHCSLRCYHLNTGTGSDFYDLEKEEVDLQKKNIDKEGNEYCFSYMPNNDGGFLLVKFYKGVAGYGPLSHTFKDQDDAKAYCKELNKDLGISEVDVQKIELSVIKAAWSEQVGNFPK